MNTLDRYILVELVTPFAFGVSVFTSLFVAGDVLFQVARMILDGAPFLAAAKLFVLSLPRIVVLTFPMSMLLATLLAFGRLSAGSEIVALRAAGVSVQRLLIPVVLVGCAVSCVTFVMNETVVPRCNEKAQELASGVLREHGPAVTRNVLLQDFAGGRLVRLVVAEEFRRDSGELVNVTMQEFDGGRLVRVTSARRASWRSGYWEFEDGSVYSIGPAGRVIPITFDRQTSPIRHTPEQVAARRKTPEEMSASELSAAIRAMRDQGGDTRNLWVQFYLRFAVPLASLVFVLVGAPLGIQSHRAATSVGFGLSVIIIFVYYVIMSVSTALGQRGAVSPFVGAWAQNFILGFAGVVMVARSR